jgi:hypothetical protein
MRATTTPPHLWRREVNPISTLAVILTLVFCSCHQHPRRLVVDRIVIDAPESLDNRVTERDGIRLAAGERLRHDDSIDFRPGQPGGTHILQLTLGELQTAGTRKPGRLIAVRLRPVGEQPEYFATGVGTAGKDLTAAVMAGFDDAWNIVTAERVLEEKDSAAMIGALADSDARLREFAIDRLGERKIAAAVEPLIARLTAEDDPSLVLRIVGALVVIHDDRAVDPLITLTHRKDAEFVMQIVYALGALGSRQAEAYLVTMASGHPDDDVRGAAKQALAELLQHRKRTGPQKTLQEGGNR